MSYTEIIESLPEELRVPIARLVDALKDELGVKRADFDELKAIVRDLAEAQKRTEVRIEELAEAQKRTEVRVEELAEAQKRTEDELVLFRRTFTSQIGGLSARWGLQSEEAFRQGMQAILQEVGFTTERFLEYDPVGTVFGHPEQIELDIVTKNGKVIVIEIKSALDRANVYIFARKVEFYTQRTGRDVNQKLIITPYADTRAKEIGVQLGIEICTDITLLS
ncbi:MAG: PD-(D/E)XK nuclease family protein [Candidatus Binatia bacterium]